MSSFSPSATAIGDKDNIVAVQADCFVDGGIRPAVRGKFIFIGDTKFFIKGVTYGAFQPDDQGREYQNNDTIERDFAQMAANGINAVRIPHTMPPRALLDIAQRNGLYVMVGLSAEQYVGYLLDKKDAPDLDDLVRTRVQACAGHPALLCYAIGNEIPAPMSRFLGKNRVEQYLRKMYQTIKTEDPGGLVTYVNYPSTEYLDLGFLDFVSFNVYLESEDSLEGYLARLQNIAGNRPLIMSEVGLDSLRNGEAKQAHVLDWQIRIIFESGCAGAFIFAWTDEWYRANGVDDWDFGLTRRDRSPKPALAAVREAFAEAPFREDREWPRVSVVVCSYNGARTIRDCLEGLTRIRYPNFEVIVVDDGSTDDTSRIAGEYDFKLIRTKNRGLSNARNLGWQAATGEIVAYTDDDAYPDADWLTYLAAMFVRTDYAGIGGPNISPPDDGLIAECVANSPGGPVHVLLSDSEAEHIPGCNMAFRRSALEAIGGFDTQFRVAGDDVDVCWRLQARGWKLGFCASAQVWHHSRNSVRTFWKQQRGYGRAEALLEKKWPEKYNAAGHPTWMGRVYSDSVTRIGLASRASFGQWCTAPFQLLYQSNPGRLHEFCLMPEWYLVNLFLLTVAGLGFLWSPLFLAAPVLLISTGLPVWNIGATAARVRIRSNRMRTRLRILTAVLHMMQPMARLYGRIAAGLTLWRGRPSAGFVWPTTRNLSVWTGHWQLPEIRLEHAEAALLADREPIRRGGDYDRWDLEVSGGLLGDARLMMVCEDGAEGHQLVRFRITPWFSKAAALASLGLASASVLAGVDNAWTASGVLGALSLILIAAIVRDCGGAEAAIIKALRQQLAEEPTATGAHRTE